MAFPSAHILCILVIGLSVTVMPTGAYGEVSLPAVFSDHMVLQRDAEVPVFGTAAPGEAVTVTFRDQRHQITAGTDGTWRILLHPLAAGGPAELRVAGTNTVTRTDVLVGEVWVGSGQSNMAGPVKAFLAKDAALARLAAAAPYPRLRLLTSAGVQSTASTWHEASPRQVETFSALMVAFGLAVQQELDVPVGLMVGAVSGTPSGAWINKPTLAAALAGRHLPAQLLATPGTTDTREIGGLYETHIRPLVGYGIRGVLWDQGESGTGLEGIDQLTVMPALIGGWRADWRQGEFPFLFVQKPSGGGCAWDSTDPITSMARPFSPLPRQVPDTGKHAEESVKLMRQPHAAMVITSDLGPGLHPPNKSGYGLRAARVALGMVYGRPMEYYGPVYQRHEIRDGRIRVKFTHVGKGLASRHGDRLQGFAIAGDDRVFLWADAEIDGDAVIVSSPSVPRPIAVRYAWASTPTWANLFNKDGLPAVPFRTDDWALELRDPFE